MSTKDKIGLIIIITLIIALSIFVGLFIYNRNRLEVAEHNIIALNDTITSVEMKNGELLEYKNSLIIEKNEIEKYLDISNKEIKELEKKLNEDIIYISKLEGSYKTDTIYITDSVAKLDTSTYRYYFNDFNEYYDISGYTDVMNLELATTTITENNVNLNLQVGLDDNWKIFVNSENPYIRFNSINGALLDKDYYLKKEKKRRFGVGIQAGFGIQYNLMHKTFDYGPYIGVGISYNFLVF